MTARTVTDSDAPREPYRYAKLCDYKRWRHHVDDWPRMPDRLQP